MRNAEGRFTVAPVHPGRDISVGTLRRIIRDTGLSIEEFVAALWLAARWPEVPQRV
ncbi:type II toxin-antitoxin system HicA family toxin [Frankia gtarii]|uniref:type II toxin-antitoxin system HicA family toxin n=1 Tax=Frankia gtarii TaxID=2950102 RepID=UPI0021C1C608|nr:type II toxin-antitoxin system HicA family toxin [Frankia gtarii]